MSHFLTNLGKSQDLQKVQLQKHEFHENMDSKSHNLPMDVKVFLPTIYIFLN